MLEIHKSNVKDVHLLELRGKFLAGSGHTFWEAVQDAVVINGYRKILVDFSNVAECDSFGISELLKVNKSLDYMSGKMMIINLNELISKVFTITKVVDVLHIREGMEQAMADLEVHEVDIKAEV